MTIKAPRDITGLWQLWQQAFGDTEDFLELFFTKGFSPERCRCIYDGDRPVSMLYWFDCRYGSRKLAYLYAVATDKAYQRQGLCRILMEDTHRHLEKLGYDGAILVPGSPTLFAYYSRFGYKPTGYLKEFSCTGAEAVSLVPVSAEEYAVRRQQYLPENGVVQDIHMIHLLAGYCKLYAGEGFLTAVCEDKGTLLIRELLGESRHAQGILSALGYETGIVRTPGTEKPFAMTLWFNGAELAENLYFGLALD